MNSKSIGADIVYAWKDASMSMMDAAPAVKIMYAKEIEASENPGQLIKEKTAEYSEKMEKELLLRRREALSTTLFLLLRRDSG